MLKLLKTIPWTELEPDTSGGAFSAEWNTYLRLVGQLLADGHEGRWVLIVAEELVGIWDTEDEATAVRFRSYLTSLVLIRQVLAHEPVFDESPPDSPRRISTILSPRTIPWTELKVDTSGRELATEWNHYLRTLGQLLADGHEGRWVLIAGEAVVGIWNSGDEAFAKMDELYPLEAALVQQVRSREPLLRGPIRLRARWAS